ncbi:hypothetical protein SACC_24660 [Saccharolobus caldissimus]|uniref:Uncharacterized protein n=1 Tax=Saccharolobus caldissimus TaxID=1702097 RepID=A0AAQ4CUG8_9CREN|nr:hypothetical protein SACC_24660 [Saccharolobus caldissimus]
MKNYGYIIIFDISEYVHLNELSVYLIYKQLINNEI